MSLATRLQFEKIWDRGRWASDGIHRSGTGSSLAYTANLREQLPGMIARYGIESVFDAPCGDLTWMSVTNLGRGVAYLGADIAYAIVDELKRSFPERRFVRLDITEDRFPVADLWLCRFCLNHLSYADMAGAFRGVLQSSTKFALFTHHPGATNRDVKTGGFRRLNLLAPPFAFGAPLETIEEPRSQMLLWKVSDIRAPLENFAP